MEKPISNIALGLILTVLVLLSVAIGLAAGFKLFSPPPSRSAVYEIPMAKNTAWRVTTFQGKVYVLIEAPSMPEDIKKGGP